MEICRLRDIELACAELQMIKRKLQTHPGALSPADLIRIIDECDHAVVISDNEARIRTVNDTEAHVASDQHVAVIKPVGRR